MVHHEGARTPIVPVHHEGDEKDDHYSEGYEHSPPAANTSAGHPSQLEGVRGVCGHGLTLCPHGLDEPGATTGWSLSRGANTVDPGRRVVARAAPASRLGCRPAVSAPRLPVGGVPACGTLSDAATLVEGARISPPATFWLLKRILSRLAEDPSPQGHHVPPGQRVTRTAPTGTTGDQLIQGVVYGDTSGQPGSLLAKSNPITYSSTNAAGWYDLALSSPISVKSGTYWIGLISGGSKYVAGFRWSPVPNARAYNPNTYTSGPTDPFGTPIVDNEQMSIYATVVRP